MPVVGISLFEVPEGRRKEFIRWWIEMSKSITREPGCISARFHQNLDPKARFGFVEVTEWQSPGFLRKTQQKYGSSLGESFQRMSITPTVSLYEIIKEYPAKAETETVT